MAAIKNWLWDKVLDSFVGKLAKDPDLQATVLGFIAAAIITKHVDFKAVLAANVDAIATLILAIVVGIFAWRTNKKHPEEAPKS